MRNRWLWTAICCWALAGCGDHSSGKHQNDMSANPQADMALGADLAGAADLSANPVDMAITTWAKFSADYAAAFCQHAMKCGKLDQAQLPVCLQRSSQLTGWDFDAEVAKGRVGINETNCLAAVAAARCDNSDAQGVADICSRLLYKPQQAIGQVCVSSVECTSGFCKHGNLGSSTTAQPDGCPGSCAPITATGAACTIDEECGGDAFCDNDPSNGNVATHTCMSYLAAGADCSNIVNNKQTCHPTTTYCPTVGTGTTCVAPTASADANGLCDPAQTGTTTPPCKAGLYCKIAGSTASCQPQVAAMDTCHGDDADIIDFVQFTDSQCVDKTFCYSLDQDNHNAAGQCASFGSIGAACKRFSATSSSCKQGLRCVASGAGSLTGTCAALALDGEACSLSSDCATAPGFLQNCIADDADAGTYTTCQPAKTFGQSCRPSYEDSLCWPAGDPGSAYCAPINGGGGVCAPKCS